MTESTHLSPAELLDRLDELGIQHRTVRHAPVFTVAEAKELRGAQEGGHSKSLFLKNKKGQMWLVVVSEDQPVSLEVLAATLDARRLSFGSPDRLMRYLGVVPGSVTPFAVVNDRAGDVTVAISADLLENELLNFHPLVNDQTTRIASQDLLRFLAATGHEPLILEQAQITGVPS
ncbi:MAG: prolyl-tRNA synthetase associated domain-containing protein [Acidimicrobiia bacterium]|nr:prolyl-tRNA synthetase associated domain-containing protein [Acidimicrobiia bacterium]